MENQTQMTKEHAIKVIEHVSSVYNGNLQEHQTIQQAIILIKSELFKDEPEKEVELKTE